MLKFWSEVPAARLREVVADIATWAWVALWAVVGWRVFEAIAGFADAGRILHEGGTNIQGAGVTLGSALSGLPLVGTQVNQIATDAFSSAGEPFVFVGDSLEALLILLARLVAFLVVAVMLIPWLSRYLPWRAQRLTALRAAHRVIRRAPHGLPAAAVNRVLASRAMYRMSYAELLEHTPDPMGDFEGGRFDRLARAELESVGLRLTDR
jgi:hypothetical protein